MNKSPKHYIPGVCNIGPQEIRMRKQSGWTALSITIAAIVALSYSQAPSVWYLALFFPATGAAIGLIQGYSEFCVAFGMKGLFNVSKEVGMTESITQKEFRAQDQKKSVLLIMISLMIGILIALAGYLLTK